MIYTRIPVVPVIRHVTMGPIMR